MPSRLILAQREFSRMVNALMTYAEAQGYWLRFGDVLRSTDKLKLPTCRVAHSYQELLVFNDKSDTLNSRHADRLAVDFEIERMDGAPMSDQDYLKLGEFWEALGGKWGGRWKKPKDYGHFENPLKPVPKLPVAEPV